FCIIHNQRPVHRYREFLLALLELPSIHLRRPMTEVDAMLDMLPSRVKRSSQSWHSFVSSMCGGGKKPTALQSGFARVFGCAGLSALPLVFCVPMWSASSSPLKLPVKLSSISGSIVEFHSCHSATIRS